MYTQSHCITCGARAISCLYRIVITLICYNSTPLYGAVIVVVRWRRKLLLQKGSAPLSSLCCPSVKIAVGPYTTRLVHHTNCEFIRWMFYLFCTFYFRYILWPIVSSSKLSTTALTLLIQTLCQQLHDPYFYALLYCAHNIKTSTSITISKPNAIL